MNEQNFDRLFKEKLTGHLQSPPVELVEKLEAKLAQRRRSAWMQFARVAAVFALLAVSVYLLNHLNTPNSSQVATHEKVADEQPSEQRPQYQAIDIIEPAPIKSSLTGQSVENPTRIASVAPKTAEPERKLEKEVESDKEKVMQEPERHKVIITYKRTAQKPVPTEEPALVMEEQPKKKSKKGKKFWRKAKMVDYQSFTLAGIRSTKDQLFAINKKDKTKGTKPN